ncbi:hypothetical protein ACKAV7_005569 [Fusarium commune]
MLLRALDRWDALWTDAYEGIPKDERKWLGIGKHTPEVMSLSRRTIELIESGKAKESAYLQDIAFYDTAVFHDFVQKYGQESPVLLGNAERLSTHLPRNQAIIQPFIATERQLVMFISAHVLKTLVRQVLGESTGA